jgi:hypothetical protein
MSTPSVSRRTLDLAPPSRLRDLILVVAMLGTLNSASAQPIAFLVHPDGLYTAANDISGNNVVGYFTHASTFRQYGYKFDGTNYTRLEVPDSEETTAEGIDGERIVGTYRTGAPDYAYLGYVYDGASYQTLQYPGSGMTFAEGISGGSIVGSYSLSSGPGSPSHGFHYDGTNYTTIDYPGAYATSAADIDGNRIVGWYSPADESLGPLGFVYDGANFTSLSYPGSLSTTPYGISGSNIVGSYTNSAGQSRGFVYDGSDWSDLAVPYSTSTSARGIDGDKIVGTISGPGVQGFQTTIPVAPKEHVFRFTGVVTSVADADGWFNGSFAVGQQIEGTYNLFDGAMEIGGYYDPNTNEQVGVSYRYFTTPNPAGIPVVPASIQVQVGGESYESDQGPSSIPYSLRISDNSDGTVAAFPVGDNYILQSQFVMPEHFHNLAGNPILGPANRWLPAFGMSLRLNDPTGAAISSLDLPLTAPDLAAFASAFGRLSILDLNGNPLPNPPAVLFNIQSISAVPEPTTLLTLSVLLLGLPLSRIRF